MAYFYRSDYYKPKSCIWGPRLKEGIILTKAEWNRLNQQHKRGHSTNLKLTEKKEAKKKKLPKIFKPIQTIAVAEKKSEKKKIDLVSKNRPESYYKDHKIVRKILSAAALAAILQEQKNQRDFNNKLKSIHRKKEEFDKETCLKKVLEFEKESRLLFLKEIQRKKEFESELKKQMYMALQKAKEEQNEKNVEKQILDLKNLKFKNFLAEEKIHRMKLKRDWQNDINAYLKNENLIEHELKEKENEENQKCQVYQRVAEYLENERKQREKIKNSNAKLEGIKIFEKNQAIIKKREESENKETDKRQKDAYAIISEDISNLKRERLSKKEKEIKEMTNNYLKNVGTKKAVLGIQQWKKEESDEQENETSDGNLKFEMEKKTKERKEVKALEKYSKEDAKEKKYRQIKDKNRFDLNNSNESVMKYCNYVLERTKELKRPLFPLYKALREIDLEFGVPNK